MPNLIRCLLVDDHENSLLILRSILEKFPHVRVVGSCHSAVEAQRFVGLVDVDLIFVDVEMQGLSGLELIRAFGPRYHYVIVSAHRQYALEGFELEVVDYLLKTVDEFHVLRALRRYDDVLKLEGKFCQQDAYWKEMSERILPAGTPATSPNIKETGETEHFTILGSSKRHIIRYSAIHFIEAMDDYIKLHTAESGYLHRFTMCKAQKVLEEKGFVRIHKSYIVNKNLVRSFRYNEVALTSGRTLPVGRQYRRCVKQALGSKGQ